MPWYGYALITALAIALVGLMQKKTLQNEHSSEYVMVFSVLKLMVFFGVVRTAVTWTVTSQQFGLLILTGTLAGIAFYCISKALRRLDLSVVAPILALDSGLSSIIALIILHETLTGGQTLGLSLLLFGTYVLELHRFPEGWWKKTTLNPWLIFEPFVRLAKSPGGGFALLGLLFYAGSGVVDRAVLQQVSTTTYLAYVLPTIAVVSICIFVATKTKLTILRPGSRIMLLPIFLAASVHLVSNVTQAQATALMAVGLVLAVKRLSSLIDVLLSGKLFHEHAIAQKAIASSIMLIGLYFVVAH